MKKIILILCLTYIFTSCASLTRTQIDNVNEFGKVTNNFSLFPSKILIELSDVRKKRGLLYTTTIKTPNLKINELDAIYKQSKSDFNASEKVDITLKIIDKYAQSLIILSSKKHVNNLEAQAKKFGIGIDSLTAIYNSKNVEKKAPIGIGKAIKELIVLGGRQYIKVKQAKHIKKFVSKGDALIELMTANLLEFLNSSNINQLIIHEEKMIRRDYLTYLNHHHKITIQSQIDYLNLKKSINGIKSLHTQTIKATIGLRKAHQKLLNTISTKKKLKESIKEIKELYEDVKELNNIIKKFQII